MHYIDAHLHVRLSENVRFYEDFTFDELLKIQGKEPAKLNFIMINPALESVFCKKDITHFVTFQDTGTENELSVLCTHCQKEIYRGPDPYRKSNEELLEKCRNQKAFVPFITLAMSNDTIPYEMEYFENKYGDEFCGYKIHPALNMRDPNELTAFNSNRPLIVHSGTQSYTSPDRIVEFAKKYAGNVDIAHLACFNDDVLSLKNKPENLFFDVSPLSVLLSECKCGEDTQFLDARNIGEEDLLKITSDYIKDNRYVVMFGSDVPFTNRGNELVFFNKYFSQKEYFEDVMYNNAFRFGGEWL